MHTIQNHMLPRAHIFGNRYCQVTHSKCVVTVVASIALICCLLVSFLLLLLPTFSSKKFGFCGLFFCFIDSVLLSSGQLLNGQSQGAYSFSVCKLVICKNLHVNRFVYRVKKPLGQSDIYFCISKKNANMLQTRGLLASIQKTLTFCVFNHTQ